MNTPLGEQIVRVKAAFSRAAGADAAGRARELKQLHREDPEAADLLRQLLQSHDDPENIDFALPMFRLDDLLSDPETDADSVFPGFGDRYRVLRLLGCGSVGDVYLAEESLPITRQVAIKVFRPHQLDSTRVRRFALEARALATVSHPGIAQVYGAGETEDGRPYLAMEYVPGRPIDAACVEAQLDPRAILELFTELCQAVQHAHQRGIIHRDLKPSNVLVVNDAGTMQVKIIDFGVAKLIDEAGSGAAGLTMQGQVLGTLNYMSPEQWCGGQADTRSDVYSLAVILYRLLTQRMPFQDGGSEARASETSRCKPHDMPELPGWMRRDVQTVIAKALSADAAERYGSPLHLAEDVHRILRGEPILARRASILERTRKLVRRNPRTSALGALLMTAVLALSAHMAVSRRQLANEVQMQQTLVIGLLDDVLDRLHVLTGAMKPRQALAASLLQRTEQLLRSSPHDVHLRQARGRLLMELGNIELEQNNRSAANHLHQSAVDIFRELLSSPEATVETWRRYAEAHVRLGDTLRWTRTSGVLEQYRQAMDVHLQLFDQYPDHLGVIDDLCWSYDRVGAVLVVFGELEEAEPLSAQRLELAERLLEMDPQRSLSKFNLMKAHYNVANLLFRKRGDTTALRVHLDQALALGDHVLALEPDRLQYRQYFGGVQLLCARLALREGDHAEARHYFQRLDEETSRLHRDNPENFLTLRERCNALIEYAHAAMVIHDHREARELYLRAVDLAERHPEMLYQRHRDRLEQLKQHWERHSDRRDERESAA